MIDVMAPKVYPARDILLPEDPLDGPGIFLPILPCALAGTDDDIALPVLIEVSRVFQVGQVGQGGVKIDIVIHIVADAEM